MRQILVYRHAKAEKSDGDIPDPQRRLLPRGRRQCESIGVQLAERGLLPDAVVTSSAVRARETAARTAESAGFTGAITEEEILYDATPRTYLSVLQDLPEGTERIMLVGHNPTVEEFVEHASGQVSRMKTAHLAVLETDLASWREIAPDTRFTVADYLEPEE
jgi:phosphohistidine phosphatase